MKCSLTVGAGPGKIGCNNIAESIEHAIKVMPIRDKEHRMKIVINEISRRDIISSPYSVTNRLF